MAKYDALKEILGKTIKGVIVKKNEKGTSRPCLSILSSTMTHPTAIYGLSYQLCRRVDPGGMDRVRQYGIPPKGPMINVLDISLDDESAANQSRLRAL